jgi:hypothetical protein
MSMKELLEIVTHEKKGKEILLVPKPGEKIRKNTNQTCIHGINRQTCSACVGGGMITNKPQIKRGVHYGI